MEGEKSNEQEDIKDARSYAVEGKEGGWYLVKDIHKFVDFDVVTAHFGFGATNFVQGGGTGERSVDDDVLDTRHVKVCVHTHSDIKRLVAQVNDDQIPFQAVGAKGYVHTVFEIMIPHLFGFLHERDQYGKWGEN